MTDDMAVTDLSHRHSDRAERQQVLRARCRHPTGTFMPFRKEETEQSLPARFEQQVHRYPGRVAFKSKRRELTYDALNQAANRVARAIVAYRGDGQEPVGLLLSEDDPLIAAILGVLKAGKIAAPLYLPDIQEAGLGHMASWLVQQEITIYCSIPTIFRHFLDTLSADVKFPRLRLIHLGGSLSTREI